MTDAVRIERRGHLLEVTLDRKVNAIGIETSRRLGEAFVALRDDPAPRVCIRSSLRRPARLTRSSSSAAPR